MKYTLSSSNSVKVPCIEHADLKKTLDRPLTAACSPTFTILDALDMIRQFNIFIAAARLELLQKLLKITKFDYADVLFVRISSHIYRQS